MWIRHLRAQRSTGGVGTSGGGGTKSGGGDDPGLLPRAAGAAPSSPSIAASGAASSANLLSPHLNEALRAEILEYTRGAIIDATLAAAEALRDRAIDVAARQVLGDGLGVATASPRGSYGAMAPAPERELRAAGGSGYAAPADYASSAATLIPRRRTASSVDANREVYQKAQLLEDLWLSEAALGAGDIMDFACVASRRSIHWRSLTDRAAHNTPNNTRPPPLAGTAPSSSTTPARTSSDSTFARKVRRGVFFMYRYI